MVVENSSYISEVITGRICKVALRRDGILHIDIKADESFVENDFHEIMDAAYSIGKGKKFYNLITVGAYTVPDHQSRELSTHKSGSIYKLADAFVIHSFSQKLVANFYMNFHKPYVPTRFFNSVQPALEWLKEQKINQQEII
ncbi:MAG: hypothetical protein JWO32_164 [Bacteroidetes bacterium]|nr:hypothetical protein [Bacteroidota bacterium]